MADTAAEKSKALDLALSQIEKQFGKGSIMKLGSNSAIVPVEVIPTGSISLDGAGSWRYTGRRLPARPPWPCP
jgi:RecA/RadA recombinase